MVLLILSCFMLEAGRLEICIKFAVHMTQDIQVESRANAGWVIVGIEEDIPGLHQVYAKEHGITNLQAGMDVCQQLRTFLGTAVPYAAA